MPINDKTPVRWNMKLGWDRLIKHIGNECENTFLKMKMFHCCEMDIHRGHLEGILPKEPYPPCLRMADWALLVGYPRSLVSYWQSHLRCYVSLSPDNALLFAAVLTIIILSCFQENILRRIHYHIANAENEDTCHVPHCIAHKKFAMSLVEQVRQPFGVAGIQCTDMHLLGQLVQLIYQQMWVGGHR